MARKPRRQDKTPAPERLATSFFEFALYRGRPFHDEEIATVLRECAPQAPFFRHAHFLSEYPDGLHPRVHLLALYEPIDPAPELAEPSKELSLVETMQAAWKTIRPSIARARERQKQGQPQALLAAHALSLSADDAFWFSLGHFSRSGGYARFVGGDLVEPGSPDALHIAGDDYEAEPERLWAAAAGEFIKDTPSDLFHKAFEAGGSALIDVKDGSEGPFDPAKFELLIE